MILSYQMEHLLSNNLKRLGMLWKLLLQIYVLTGPTEAPKNVRIAWIKETSAQLSWKAIPCAHQNGKILRYLVRHDYELPNGTFAVQQFETSWNALEITLTNLRPNRNYFVRVAGVNEAGVGAFSLPIRLITPGGIYQQTYSSRHFKSMIDQCCFLLSLSLSRQSANHIS